MERNSRRSAHWIILILICFGGLLQGCAEVGGSEEHPVPAQTYAQLPPLVRSFGPDQQFHEIASATLAAELRRQLGSQPIDTLALSGGGAAGAFGAGALVGLGESGHRPRFAVVTGVSAGALVAPYAFLGPRWDPQLIDAYTSGSAEHVLRWRGLGLIFGSSLYSGEPLEQLIERYVSDALVLAIAHEAAGGRLLLVATTNVDTGEPVVWNLGSIARYGGPQAKSLLREVLVASASVPGLFPPVSIRVKEDGSAHVEAHVDGAVTVPFFVGPILALPPTRAAGRSAGSIYVLVDGPLGEAPQATRRLRAQAILTRSVDAGLHLLMRTTLELTAVSAQLRGLHLQYSAMPVAYPYDDAFDFRRSTVQPMFRYGYDCARAQRLWTALRPGADEQHPGHGATTQAIPCPADDAFIERLAGAMTMERFAAVSAAR
jgi:predicted acylesterase/phospholipase RssA